MKKIYKYTNYLYRALQIFIGLDIFFRCKDDFNNLIIFLGLYLIIIINDILRVNYFYKSIKKYYLSIVLTMIISLVMEFLVDGYMDIYFYMILYELILYTEGKISLFLVVLQILAFLSLIAYRLGFRDLGSIQFWQENILDIAMIFMFIFFYSLSLYSYKILRKEKMKVDKLNKELELSYIKLKEQSEKIEELTITKERNRLAREIHDNLGHSLVALNMTLDVAEKTMDKDFERAKELIRKSQKLAKDSMENLRRAVYALKEEGHESFIKSIKEVVENIESTGMVVIRLNIEDESENLIPEYKEIIYFAIKEAITNSIKHGKAEEIKIELEVGKYVKLSVKDNGVGCKTIKKGNGLLGIEARIKDYNGKVSFLNDNGFMLELILPYL